VNKTGHEIIAYMKEIKAQAEGRVSEEIERLFLDRLEKPNKTEQEQMGLWNDLEKTEQELIEREIKNNPELASCFYKPPFDKEKSKKEFEEAFAEHNKEWEKELKKQGKTYGNILNIWFFGSMAFGALAMLAFLKVIS